MRLGRHLPSWEDDCLLTSKQQSENLAPPTGGASVLKYRTHVLRYVLPNHHFPATLKLRTPRLNQDETALNPPTHHPFCGNLLPVVRHFPPFFPRLSAFSAWSSRVAAVFLLRGGGNTHKVTTQPGILPPTPIA